MGSAGPSGLLVRRADVFVNVFMKRGIRRRTLTPAERRMYRRPHPTPRSRVPVHVMPRKILAAHALLAEVAQGLGRLADKPAPIVWGDKDVAFREPQLPRWEATFPHDRTRIPHGAAHYSREDAPDEIVAAVTDWWPRHTSPG
jgi:haloalkane dehalogenase